MQSINLPIMGAQVLTFIVALIIVWKFAWKMLIQMIEQRRETIKKNLEHAEQTRVAITKLEEEYKLQLKQIHDQSAQLLNASRAEANQVREKLLQDTQKEIGQMQQQAREQLAFERKQLVEALKPEIVNLAVLIAEKALQQSPMGESNRKRFEDVFKSLDTYVLKDKRA